MYNREEVITRDMYKCQSCGGYVRRQKVQIAHKIHNGEGGINFFRERLKEMFPDGPMLSRAFILNNMVNHPLNVCVTCGSYCNDMQNIMNKKEEASQLRDLIIKDVLDY